MTEKQIEDNLRCFIDTMNKKMEGKIVKDENGYRWKFHNGRWEAMCHIEPLSFEPKK